jgi:hypothetical protein
MGYGNKAHYNDSQNSDTTAPSGRELYHLQFSFQVASPETFGYTLVRLDTAGGIVTNRKLWSSCRLKGIPTFMSLLFRRLQWNFNSSKYFMWKWEELTKKWVRKTASYDHKNYDLWSVKGKVVPVLPPTEHDAMKAPWGSGATAPPIPRPRH